MKTLVLLLSMIVILEGLEIMRLRETPVRCGHTTVTHMTPIQGYHD